MMIDPWTGTHDDVPVWDGGWDVDALRTVASLAGMVVAAWAVPAVTAVYIWRKIRL